MKNVVRACTGNRAFNRRKIPHVTGLMVLDPVGESELLKQGRFGGRWERKPVDLRTEGKKPFAQPAPLEPRVARDKNALVSEAF
jgi:hypothetical protein